MIQSRCRTLFLSVIAGAAGLTAPPILAQSPDPAELATTVQDGFTIATVGDLIIAYPMEHMLADPGFREVVELIQTADVATGNLETNIIDGRTFRGSRGGGFGAEPESARSLVEMGFDIVVHSATKYLNGHSDMIGGVAVCRGQALAERLGYLQNALGAVASPFDSFLALRGLKTLALRMERHSANARQLAEWLERHPKIERVIYPGLPSHPQHELAWRQMRGFGGMVSAVVRGSLAEVTRFLTGCQVFTLAESLGGVESLIEHPAIMTHASVPPEVRRELGIDDGLVRLSVGVEDVEDLIADLAQALETE